MGAKMTILLCQDEWHEVVSLTLGGITEASKGL